MWIFRVCPLGENHPLPGLASLCSEYLTRAACLLTSASSPPIQILTAHSAHVHVHRALDPKAHSSALFFSAHFTPAVLCLAWATFFFCFPFHVIRGDLTVWPSLASNFSSSSLCLSSAEITDMQSCSPSCLSNFSSLFPGHGFVYTRTLNLSLF